MTLVEIATAALVLAMGATLQSAVGFGMALFAIPLLVLGDRPLPAAVALVLGAAAVQTAHGTLFARRHIRWRWSLAFAAIQWVALALGVAGMSLLVASDPVAIKRTVGAAVLVVVTTQLVVRPAPRERLGTGWMVLTGAAAGFLGGLVGMGGPPLVLYALAHRWSRDAFRGFLWSQFLLVLPVLAMALVVRFGPHIFVSFSVGVAMAPVVWLGSRLGLALTERWEPRHVTVAAVIGLYAIGLTSLLAPGPG